MSDQRAKFTQMKDGDAEDYSIIAASNAKDYDHLADKVLDHLRMLEHDYGGFQVTRLTHCLQTATRAYRDTVAIIEHRSRERDYYHQMFTRP